MSDIVERLKHCSDNCGDEYLRELSGRAADEITSLRAEVEKLRAALEGFVCDCEGEQICIGSCQHKNARAALGDSHE